jgi:hypothetical protein
VASIDVGQLSTQIQAAASAVIGQDVKQLRGFSLQQVNDIAQQAADIAAGVADGSINPDNRAWFMGQLEEMTRSFVNTLAGMAVVVVEEVWNAVAGAVWGQINRATGLALTVP